MHAAQQRCPQAYEQASGQSICVLQCSLPGRHPVACLAISIEARRATGLMSVQKPAGSAAAVLHALHACALHIPQASIKAHRLTGLMPVHKPAGQAAAALHARHTCSAGCWPSTAAPRWPQKAPEDLGVLLITTACEPLPGLAWPGLPSSLPVPCFCTHVPRACCSMAGCSPAAHQGSHAHGALLSGRLPSSNMPITLDCRCSVWETLMAGSKSGQNPAHRRDNAPCMAPLSNGPQTA